MTEMLIGSIAIALTFTAVICWVLYAVISELTGLKPAQRRVARRCMMRGDRRAAHSMVLYEKSVLASGHPEAWYWKAAIQRLERDRR